MRLFLGILLLALGSVLLQQVTGCGTIVGREEGMARGFLIILPLFLVVLYFFQRVSKNSTRLPTRVEQPKPSQRNEGAKVTSPTQRPDGGVLFLSKDMISPSNNDASDASSKPRIYDREAWSTLKKFDPTVSAALEKITPLGDRWVAEFANRATTSRPEERDAARIAAKVIEEHAASLRISSNDAINDAYLRVSELYGDAGATRFKEIYQIVGDNMDAQQVFHSVRDEMGGGDNQKNLQENYSQPATPYPTHAPEAGGKRALKISMVLLLIIILGAPIYGIYEQRISNIDTMSGSVEGALSADCSYSSASVLPWTESDSERTDQFANNLSIFELSERIQTGDRNAYVALAHRYRRGKGVKQDHEKMRQLLSVAASLGDSAAINNLGIAHQHGEGGPVNYNAALRCFEISAHAGNPVGMFNLGYMHDNGLGTPLNHKEAAYFYSRAANKDSAVANWNMSVMYETGQGVTKSRSVSVEYAQKAARLGHPDAIAWLNSQGIPY